nr:copia protein [Tanacetum cinerariifolium]
PRWGFDPGTTSILRPEADQYPNGSDIKTVVYANSDHVGDCVDQKSTSGICTFMGCCLTSWFSKKQTALAISTTEVKYVSAKKACQQALWMKQASVDYDIRLDDIPVMSDNKRAIDLRKNPVQHSHTKHIKIRHHFLRDNVQKENISDEVETPTPIPKPPSPCNELSKEISPMAPSNQASPQPHSPPPIDLSILEAKDNANFQPLGVDWRKRISRAIKLENWVDKDGCAAVGDIASGQIAYYNCRIEETASWDLGKRTWGGRVRSFGTVPVRWGCTGMTREEVVLLARKTVYGTVRNSP